MSKVQIVVGGQFGSEGKGAVAAHIAKDRKDLMCVRVAGPNAGHSALDPDGRKWALRQVPVMAVVNPEATLVLAAGSEIDEEVLCSEIDQLDAAGFNVSNRIFIDGQATMIDSDHKLSEKVIDTGTTGKGIGAARAARLLRSATLWGDPHGEGDAGDRYFHPSSNTAELLTKWLKGGGDVIIEGTQGYGLGLHAGYYPYCTSSDCRSVDFLAMAGISPWADYIDVIEPIVVCRTYPIRIAGNSGPMLAEMTWEDLGVATGGHVQPEFTTVTQKLRRVGGWDPVLANQAVEANGGKSAAVALSFFDYWHPELYGATDVDALQDHHLERIREVEEELGTFVRWVSTGPDSVIPL
jgi:adenylosuccinate synthase